MDRPIGQRMSLDEFLRLPEEKPWLELVDGIVCEKPMGSWVRGTLMMKLLMLLHDHPATKPGQAYPSLTIPFRDFDPPNALIPDSSYYRAGRDKCDDRDYPLEAPDLVAEIISDGRTREGLEKRLAFFRDHGVTCTLLIDPESTSVTVHDGDRSWTASEADHVEIDSLDGVDFGVADLFTE